MSSSLSNTSLVLTSKSSSNSKASKIGKESAIFWFPCLFRIFAGKLVGDGLGPENTVPFVIWNTQNFIPEFLVEWKAPMFSNPASSWFALYFKWILRFWACCIHLTLISLLHSPDRNKHPLRLHLKAGHVAGAINMKLLGIKAIVDNYFSITPLLELQKQKHHASCLLVSHIAFPKVKKGQTSTTIHHVNFNNLFQQVNR